MLHCRLVCPLFIALAIPQDVLSQHTFPDESPDGVHLIDQNRVLAGDVTAGDDQGFPVSITEPGSDRLSGNLTVPAGLSAIVISTPNVTLDLNFYSSVRLFAQRDGEPRLQSFPVPKRKENSAYELRS